MKWKVVYFEQIDTNQPAEVFEDALLIMSFKLRGKLLQVTDALRFQGHQLGGGYIKKCHDYEGIWEIRIIQSGTLVREFFGFDKERIVMLHGYTKRVGQPASTYDLNKAFGYGTEYLRTRNISPIQEEENG